MTVTMLNTSLSMPQQIPAKDSMRIRPAPPQVPGEGEAYPRLPSPRIPDPGSPDRTPIDSGERRSGPSVRGGYGWLSGAAIQTPEAAQDVLSGRLDRRS